MTARRRPPRTQLTLPKDKQAELTMRARRAGLPVSAYATQILLAGLDNQHPSLDAAVGQPTAPPPRSRAAPSGRAPWLPPAAHIDAIVALIARYPHDLRELRHANPA